MIKRISILLSVFLCIFLIGCENTKQERTGEWDAPKDGHFNIVDEDIYRTKNYFETQFLSDMRIEDPKEYHEIIETMTEEEAVQKGKEYLPPDIKELDTKEISDGAIKEIKYSSVEGDFLITLVGSNNELESIIRMIVSQKDTNTYTDSSGKDYETTELIEFLDTLGSKSYSSELNPKNKTMEESIAYVKEILPEKTTEVSKDFEDEVGVTSIICESGDFEFEVRYMHPYNNNGDYDLEKTAGIDVSLRKLEKK